MNYKIINNDCQSIIYDIISNYGTDKTIIVTDPPFNIGYHYNTYKDNLNEDEYYEGLGSIIELTKKCCYTLSRTII